MINPDTPTVEDLMALLDPERLDEIQLDLDEIVHSLAEDDPTGDPCDVTDPDELAGLRSLWASELNNQGPEDQIRYILSQGALPDLLPLVCDIAVSGHARIALEALKEDGQDLV